MMKKPIPTVWFKHLPDEEQESFKDSLRANHHILDRLNDILGEELQGLIQLEDAPATYDSGYPFRQAQINGMRKALRQIQKYLSFLEE